MNTAHTYTMQKKKGQTMQMFPFIRYTNISTMFHELFCLQSPSGTGQICDTFLHQKNTKKCSHTVLYQEAQKVKI